MAYLGNSPLNALFNMGAITLLQGQTSINVNYTVGRCLFFKNGVLLNPNVDYTAPDGSVVTLAHAADAGDIFQGINLASFAVANAIPVSGGAFGGPITGPASAAEGTAGLIALATTAMAQAFTDDTTALTPKTLADAFNGSNQAPGYQRLPNGFLIQSGLSGGANPASLVSVTFPQAFITPNPTIVLQYVDGIANTGAARGNPTQVSTRSQAGFNFYQSGTTNACQYLWIAIGK